MSYKSNINGQLRGFYYAASGDDAFSGQTIEVPKLTIQAAIDAAIASVPAPSQTNLVLVTGSQGGSFTEGFILGNFVQFNGQDTSISAAAITVITLASGLRCRIEAVSNSQANGNVFLLNDVVDSALFCGRCGITGTGSSFGVILAGTLRDVFVNITALEIQAVGATGITVISSNTEPVDINVGTVGLEANNTTFITKNAAAVSDLTVLSVSSVDTGIFTGTTAFNVTRGILVVETAGDINAVAAIVVGAQGVLRITAGQITGAITVQSGGLLQIIASQVTGNITVDSGGIIESDIISHVGTVTNNGTLTGQINSTFYGDKQFTAAIKDSSGDAGTSGQVLSSTVTGTNWVTGGNVSTSATLTDNFLVRGNGMADIDIGNITMDSTGNNLTIPGDLNVDTDTLIVDSTNNRVSTGNVATALTDFTIFQNPTNVFKGLTFSGTSVSGPTSTTEGITLQAGFLVAGNTQLWVCNTSDLGNSAKNSFRYIVGSDVPLIVGVNNNGTLNKSLAFGLNAAGVHCGFGFPSNVTQAEIQAQVHIQTGIASVIGLIVEAETGQTADLVQIQNSSGVVTSVIDASDNWGIGTASPSTKLEISQPTSAPVGTLVDTIFLMDGGSALNDSGFSIVWGNGTWRMARIGAKESVGFGGNIVFETNLGNDTSTVEVMRITAQQTVGILTTSPTHNLSIGSSVVTASVDGDAMVFDASYSDGVLMNFEGAGRAIGVFSDGRLFMGNNVNYDPVTNSYQHAVTGAACVVEYTSAGEILLKTSVSGTAGVDFTPTTKVSVGTNVNVNTDFIVNTNNFVVNTSTNRVGIGTSIPDAPLDVFSAGDDTALLISLEVDGANGGETGIRVGGRDPDGNVSGIGGSEYIRASGATSGTYESREATTGTNWFKRDVNPSNVQIITSAAEFDTLASGGIVTISVDTTLWIKDKITTANRIVVNTGIVLHITGGTYADPSITYSGTATFITSLGTVRIFDGVLLISSSTGTFVSMSGGGTLNIRNTAIIGWDNLGTYADGSFANVDISYVNIDSGWTITNPTRFAVVQVSLSGSTLTGAFFTLSTNNPASAVRLSDVSATSLSSTSAIVDFDTKNNNTLVMNVFSCSTVVGDLFKQTQVANATINSVADGTIANGTITAQADNSAGGTTHSSTTTYFENEEVTITGTTSYNGTFQIFNVVAGVSFDTITTFAANDATGTVATVRLTITLAGGHGITATNDLKIINTNFYNGFVPALNVATNVLTVNGTFVSTNAGAIVRNVGLDQTDKRIRGLENFFISDSNSIACAHVNDNSTANGTIINNEFTDIVFGTAGSALISSSTMELWRLTDELSGTFEYIGNEPFQGLITFDYTVVSSGGTVDYRFKWQKSISTNITASTIAFVDSNPDTITDSGNGFLTAGFKAEDTIQISGTVANNITATIASVTAGTITLVASDTLVTEAAGATVGIAGLFGNLEDPVEALAAVGSDSESVTKTFPLVTSKGDKIKSQITRNSGSSGITISFATIYATG